MGWALMFAVAGGTLLFTPVVASGALRWGVGPGAIPPLHDAVGTVERVDLARGLLLVKTAAGPLELEVSPATTFLLEGRRAVFAELQRGHQVRISYEPTDALGVVHWVETEAPLAAPAAVRTAPPAVN